MMAISSGSETAVPLTVSTCSVGSWYDVRDDDTKYITDEGDSVRLGRSLF